MESSRRTSALIHVIQGNPEDNREIGSYHIADRINDLCSKTHPVLP